MSQPNRWLHLRHRDGFTDDDFALFQAHAAIFIAYVNALLEHWKELPYMSRHPQCQYIFFPAQLSPDRRVVTLPIGGDQTVGTRARIENFSSYMLWQFFPRAFRENLEEGITETTDSTKGPNTNWRKPDQGFFIA